MQAFNRRNGLAFQNVSVTEGLHAEDGDALFDENREHFLGEAPKMSIHHIKRHLHCIETKLVVESDFQRAKVNGRIFVTCETDEADLARFFCFEHCLNAAFRKNAVGIFHAEDFVELHQIHMIGLQAAERFIDLFGNGIAGAAVDFSHQKDSLTITITQGPAHALFAAAIVVIPTIIEKVYSAIDGLANQANAFLVIAGNANMKTSQSDDRDFLAGLPQIAARHFIIALHCKTMARNASDQSSSDCGGDELASRYTGAVA